MLRFKRQSDVLLKAEESWTQGPMTTISRFFHSMQVWTCTKYGINSFMARYLGRHLDTWYLAYYLYVPCGGD